jgi:hypothetical protein
MNTDDKIRFHIPDFLKHFSLNMLLLQHMRKNPDAYRDNVTVGSVYGVFPTAVWNGGRFFQGTCDERVIREVLKQFNSQGVPCRYTFTNTQLTEAHLSDRFCNRLMQLADNGLNEVIVASPVLEAYLREKYPRFPLVSSTCKAITDPEQLHAELEKDYSLVVLDYRHNNNWELLSQIGDPGKCELLADACCDPDCPRRTAHYDSISRSQIAYWEWERRSKKPGVRPPQLEVERFTCPYMEKPLYDTVHFRTHITPEDLYGRYVPAGFRNFKLEGRSLPDIDVLETYIYYLVKPEHRDQVRLELLLRLTRKVKYFS